MWILLSVSQPDLQHVLLVGKEYTVGRKDCDIIIADDMSISRKHAHITVSHPEANLGSVEKLPVLTVKDISRLGSIVHKQRIKGGQEDRLASGDTVLFGTAGVSLYKAVYEPLLATTSCLEVSRKRETKQLMIQLGGHLVNDWRVDTQLVVMSKLSVTIKVICALVCQRYVVLPEYLQALHSAINNKVKPPSPADYQPPLVESQINSNEVSFQPKSERQSIFHGFQFVFFSEKQLKKLDVVIKSAGGSCLLLTAPAHYTPGDTTCVIHCDPNDQALNLPPFTKSLIQTVVTDVKRRGHRVIMESELGFAVLLCSTVRYCNPRASTPGAVEAVLPPQSLSQMQPESQMPPVSKTQSQTVKVKEEVVSQRADPDDGSQFRRLPKRQRVEEQESADLEVPSQKSRRLNVREGVKQELVTPGGTNNSSLSDVQHVPDGALDFDTVPSRRRGGKKSAVENVGDSISSSSNGKIPAVIKTQGLSHGVKNEVSSPTQTNATLHTKRKVDTKVNSSAEHNDHIDMTNLDEFDCGVVRRGRDHRNAMTTAGGNQEKQDNTGNFQITDNKLDKMSPSTRALRASDCAAVNSISTDTSGFLMAHTASNDPARKVSPVESEEGLPCGLMQTVEENLVFKRPQPRHQPTINGQSMWKGRPVKNFKKFSKVPHAGHLNMPVIIGGSDLVANTKARSREIEEWMQQAVEEQSQQAERNKIAQDVFDYKPTSKRGKKVTRVL